MERDEIDKRLQHTEKAQTLLKKSSYLVVPWARSERIGGPILIEQKLPITPGDNLNQTDI